MASDLILSHLLPVAHWNVLLEKLCQGDGSFPARAGPRGVIMSEGVNASPKPPGFGVRRSIRALQGRTDHRRCWRLGLFVATFYVSEPRRSRDLSRYLMALVGIATVGRACSGSRVRRITTAAWRSSHAGGLGLDRLGRVARPAWFCLRPGNRAAAVRRVCLPLSAPRCAGRRLYRWAANRQICDPRAGSGHRRRSLVRRDDPSARAGHRELSDLHGLDLGLQGDAAGSKASSAQP